MARLVPAIHENYVDHRDKPGDDEKVELLMGCLLRWRMRGAAKSYSRKLGPHLQRAYGATERYSAGQIRTSVNKLGLNPTFIALAYAAFLPEAEYETAASTGPLYIPYAEAREVFERFRPTRLGGSASFYESWFEGSAGRVMLATVDRHEFQTHAAIGGTIQRDPEGAFAMIPVSARNIEFVGHTDQGGRGDGVQVMVHKGHAFVGHMFADGFTVTDVSDPRRPTPVKFVAAPPNTRAFHLQTHGDLLLTVNSPNIWVMQGYSDPNDYFKSSITDSFTKRDKEFSAGLRVWDISKPAAPREIAFMPIDGLGLHRLWYVGGRYAYASCHWQGFTDHVLAIIDMAEPTRPEVVGRWWLPGMHAAGGETPSWHGKRYALHHAIVAGNLAYAAWRDGGFTILDVSDATAPKLLSHRNWCPPFGGGSHTPLPLPDRNLAVIADEGNLDDCANGIQRCWVFDVREPTNPVQISSFPTPAEEDYCKKGAKFGPHNLHENRPGALQSSELIFATYQNAGVRVINIADPFAPREVAHFVPPPPEKMVDPRPNRPRVIQSNDVYVAPDGLMYLTDVNDGLTILQYKG